MPNSEQEMFFIQKEGVYFHGIFWVGDDAEEGRMKAELLASQDDDDYHYWVLYRFVNQVDATQDARHEKLHRVQKQN